MTELHLCFKVEVLYFIIQNTHKYLLAVRWAGHYGTRFTFFFVIIGFSIFDLVWWYAQNLILWRIDLFTHNFCLHFKEVHRSHDLFLISLFLGILEQETYEVFKKIKALHKLSELGLQYLSHVEEPSNNGGLQKSLFAFGSFFEVLRFRLHGRFDHGLEGPGIHEHWETRSSHGLLIVEIENRLAHDHIFSHDFLSRGIFIIVIQSD